MESVLRAAVTYLFLLLLFRISGKRSLAQITTFDFVLLLLISEAIQQAMIANDNSVTNAFLLIITLMGIDIGLSLWKQRSELVAKLLDDVPLVIVEDGRPLRERMDRSRVDEDDVLAAARQQRGLERMEQIKYAVLERSGGITVIAKGDGRMPV
jgi:uncharacterized membrane protein YcaP (DUF421 family)